MDTTQRLFITLVGNHYEIILGLLTSNPTESCQEYIQIVRFLTRPMVHNLYIILLFLFLMFLLP